ncbi:MAG: hypothetical protein AAF702_46305 [Chloroflexota bacterium]
MAQQTISLEWYIGEEGSPWAHGLTGQWLDVVDEMGTGSLERQMIVRILRNTAIALLATILIAGTAQPPWVSEQVRVGNGIQVAFRLEDQAHHSGDLAALGALLDEQAAGRWQHIWKSVQPTGGTNDTPASAGLVDGNLEEDESTVKLIRLEQAGHLIMAEVIVHRRAYGWTGFNPYRETRFYSESKDGWIRTMPDTSFWGTQQVLEMDHLRFELYARDAAYVQERIAQWDELYRNLHTMLGVEMPRADARLTFVITQDPVRGRGGYGDRFELTSPLLVQTPDYLSLEDYLHQSVVSRLTYHVTTANLFESSNGQQYEENVVGRWRTIRRGLRSWLRSELLDPDWPWDLQAQNVFYASLPEHHPLKLATLSHGPENMSDEREALLWRTAATASLFAYVAETYDINTKSNKHLPSFIQGFKEHRTWDALIPAIFDITMEEFENDWNHWLDLQLSSAPETTLLHP